MITQNYEIIQGEDYIDSFSFFDLDETGNQTGIDISAWTFLYTVIKNSDDAAPVFTATETIVDLDKSRLKFDGDFDIKLIIQHEDTEGLDAAFDYIHLLKVTPDDRPVFYCTRGCLKLLEN